MSYTVSGGRVNEIIAAILGASISVVAMLAMGAGKKRESFTVEIFKRLNSLDTKVARLEERANIKELED
tara:strand:+ start:3181 stop:3387 length:207 start_codon:yes stop_codon:yes gene_type:complete